MTFVHPLLLGGLVLVTIPVLIHLIMQQKPKRLPFPAFRFLLQKHRTNQRTLRLRHLLLLTLRMLLVAGICLALARPKLFSERLNLSSDRPVAVVLLFDTSPSMEYTVASRNRLDEAKRRALELLNDLPDGSRVAVFDSAEAGGEWLPSLKLAREHISGLRLRAANSPLTRQVEQSYRLFSKLEEEQAEADEPLPRLLYVFSDRAQASWDAEAARGLKQPDGVHAVFVDVGVEKPADVAIINLELPRHFDRQTSRQVFGRDDKVTLNATVRAAGADCDTTLLCQVDGKKEVLQQAVVLKAGESKVFSFEIDCRALELGPGPHQVEVKLASNDALPFDNARFATFEVRDGRRILVLADNPWQDADKKKLAPDTALWVLALQSARAFQCDVRPIAEAHELVPNELLANYKGVCLLHIADPAAGRNQDLWQKLKDYVAMGGGLAVVPGGEELKRDAYNADQAQQLLPARFEKLARGAKEPGVPWSRPRPQHPLIAPLVEWMKSQGLDSPGMQPSAFHYWQVTKNVEGALVNYADDEGRPALVEKMIGRGRVLLFTTPFDNRIDRDGKRWNNYWNESPFAFTLANLAVGYLAGDAEEINFNFQAGQVVPVELPPKQQAPTFTVQGPGLSPSETVVTRTEGQNILQITKAVTPGNFTVFDEEANRIAGFSLNVRPEECFLDRVPAEQIEALLGPKAILSVKHDTNLEVALEGHWSQPVELLPWLMILVLLLLTAECFLANRFYRRSPQEQETSQAALPQLASENGTNGTGKPAREAVVTQD